MIFGAAAWNFTSGDHDFRLPTYDFEISWTLTAVIFKGPEIKENDLGNVT